MSAVVASATLDASGLPLRAAAVQTLSRAKNKTPTLKQLAEVDWDFSERTADSPIERLHPYPAKFISDIPRTLLEILPVPTDTVVLDPFCGSGTTLVECQRRGSDSIGVDINPIACLISRVKTAPFVDMLDETISDVLTAARRMRTPRIPDIPNLNHWFPEAIQRPLAALNEAIGAAQAARRDILRLALSSIFVRVSNQESDTRYAAVHKNVSRDDVFNLFDRAARRINDALQQRHHPLANATVIEADTLALNAKRIAKPVGLVITSPPYPNAYEYWLYHKYRMWWLGFDPLAVKEREIGARAHFFKRRHHTADDFVRQMTLTLRLLQTLMVPGAYACFVVGRSKIHGRIVDNARTIKEIAVKTGFQLIFEAERILSPSRKSFNLSHANIKKETVLILRLGRSRCA